MKNWGILAVGVALIATPHLAVSWNDIEIGMLAKSISKELGIALVIAYIVILLVERQAKEDFVKEISDHLMGAIYGRQWPPELKDLVTRTLIEPRLYRDHFLLNFDLQLSEESGEAMLESAQSYVIGNMSDDPEQFAVKLGGVDDVQAPEILINDNPVQVEEQNGRDTVTVAGEKADYKVISEGGIMRVLVPVSKEFPLKIYEKRRIVVREEDFLALNNGVASTGLTITFSDRTMETFGIDLSASVSDRQSLTSTLDRIGKQEWKIGPMMVGHTILLNWRAHSN